jgi:hypothetical protein
VGFFTAQPGPLVEPPAGWGNDQRLREHALWTAKQIAPYNSPIDDLIAGAEFLLSGEYLAPDCPAAKAT